MVYNMYVHMVKKDSKQTQNKKKATEKICDNDSITLTFSWNKIKKIYDQQIKKLSSNLKTKGFRKGKVPTHIAEQKLDTQKIINAVLNQIVPPKYQEAVKKQKLKPLSLPRVKPIQTQKNKDWKVEAEFAQKPQTKITGYKKLIKQAQKTAQTKIKEIQKEQSKDKKNKKQDLTDEQKKNITLEVIFNELIKNLGPQIPSLLVEAEVEKELKRLVDELEKMKLKLEDYLQRRKIKFEQLVQEISVQSLAKIQLEFILQEITEKLKIVATDEELEQKLSHLKDEKQKKQILKDTYYRNYLTHTVKRNKLVKKLIDL